MWLSKHGSACATGDAQFPNISIADKQAYWNQIMKVFEGVVIDTQISLVNETSINTYLQRGQRLLLIGLSQYHLCCTVQQSISSHVLVRLSAILCFSFGLR